MPWPEVKRQGLVPFGQLPVLDVGDGELVAQEAAICRYCADLVPGLLPSDSLERAKCEALFHAAEELFVCNPLVNVYRGEDLEGKKREFLDNVLPRRLRNFARILRDSGGPFTMGRSPNYADFKWYHHLSNVSLLEDGALKASLGSEEASLHDAVVAFMAAVEGLEGVALKKKHHGLLMEAHRPLGGETGVCAPLLMRPP